MNTPELERATTELRRQIRTAFGPDARHVKMLVCRDSERVSVGEFTVSDADWKTLPPLYAFLKTLSFEDDLPVPMDSEELYLFVINQDYTDDSDTRQVVMALCSNEAGPYPSMVRFLEIGAQGTPSGTWLDLDLPAELPAKRMILIPWSTEDVLSVREDLTEEQAAHVLAEAEDTHDPVRGLNWTVLREIAERLYPETFPVYLMVRDIPDSTTFEWRWTPKETWAVFDWEADNLRSANLEGRVSHLVTRIPAKLKENGPAGVQVHLEERLGKIMTEGDRIALYAHLPAREH